MPDQRTDVGEALNMPAGRPSASRPLRVVAPGDGATVHNLPVRIPEFVGRARELRHVADALGSSRLVTVTGPSGIGKTRLAVEVATRLAGAYPDGAWWVDLASVAHPDLVPQAVAAALGLDPEPGRDPSAAVVARLADGEALLVLDNCEHVVHACAALADRLLGGCPALRFLATSQRPLDLPDERVASLAPLVLPAVADDVEPERLLESEAVALFCARAAQANPAFSLTREVAPAVGEICHRLDGIPLAIELAAARIVALGAADIAERLENRFRLLTRTDPRAEPRHRTLGAALDWSYDLLPDEEATLLRRMSVFCGGATLHAVEQVCTGKGAPRDEAVDLLTSLVAKSLVIAETSRARARYQLLDTVRAYCADRLEEAGETASVRARHAAWCVSTVERAWHQVGVGNDRYWVTALEADHANVRAALEWSIGSGSDLALRLAAALTPFWKTRGYLQEGQEWLRRAVDAVPKGSPALRARALYGVGLLAVMRGDVATARPAVEESLSIARKGKLKRAETQALNLLGFISIFAQDPVTARPVLEESIAMARADGDGSALAPALGLYGRAHLMLGDVAGATGVFLECLRVAEESGAGPTSGLIGLGWAALLAGELRRSEELFRRAQTVVRDVGDRFETALILSFLGQLAWSQGRLAEATALLEEGRSMAEVMGAPFPLARCLSCLAQVALAQGDVASAATLADASCEVARRAGLPYALVRGLLVRGDVRRAHSAVAEAYADYDEALSLARQSSDSVGVASALTRHARLARLRGADDEATNLLSEALTMQSASGDGGVLTSLEALAGLATAQGRPTAAAGLFGAADALRTVAGSPRTPAEVADYEADLALLRVALDDKELDAAWAQGAAMSRDEAVALALRGRGSRDRPSHGWASLSPTERQIVDLVADGLTNKEIGDRLFISDRTVQGHLARVFPKLGVSSRREIRDALRQR